MKEIIIGFLVLLLVPTALAEVNTTTNIETTGDVNIETYIDTEGNVRVVIDGTDIGQAVNSQANYILENEERWSSNGNSMTKDDFNEFMYFAVLHLFDDFDWIDSMTTKMSYKNKADDASYIGNLLDSYFASDDDLFTLHNRLMLLEYQSEAISKTLEELSPEEFCNAKLDIMNKYELNSVTCRNETFYRDIENHEEEKTIEEPIKTLSDEPNPINVTEIVNNQVELQQYIQNPNPNPIGTLDLSKQPKEGNIFMFFYVVLAVFLFVLTLSLIDRRQALNSKHGGFL